MPTQQVGDGKYKILRRLAVGGMAEIFLAEAANIHGFRKKVVIKRILPQYADEPSYVEMFLDEARLAARLNHASIVQVFDIGQDAEGVFFTMEYVEGRDLAELLGECYHKGRLLEMEEVLAVLMPAAEALHHAHELRDDNNRLCHLIHRDVSPSNILVTNEGRVKLLDFGVAKSNDQQRETTGVSLKGKFGYMAPEQCEGIGLDRRGDIFSFGVVLWELCTGRRLYPGGNDPSVLLKIMKEDAPAPSSLRPGLPPELDRICLKALARDRDRRYCTLQDVIHDLDEFARANGIVTTSRTLSRLLDDIFPECRPTEVIEAVAPEATPRPSQVAQAPGDAYAASEPASVASHAHAAPGSAPVAGYAPTAGANQLAGSMPHEGSFVEPRAGTRKWPWLVGLGGVFAAGLAFAVLGAGSDESASTDSGQAAEPATVIAPVAATPATANEAPVAAEAAPVAAAADESDEPAADESDEPAADESDEPAAPEQAPAEATPAVHARGGKARRKKPRGKKRPNSGTRPGHRQTQNPEEKWDPNSPFAPE